VPTYGIQTTVKAIGNGVRRDLFKPIDQSQARKTLGLPLDAQLIGTAGAITANRDIRTLFDAFLMLASENRFLHLIIAGPRDHTPSYYQHPRIIDLGVLPHDQVPLLFSALDVAVVCNRDSEFGRYCFPLKLFEIIACGTPIVAAKIGDVAAILAGYPNSLYIPGDASGLARLVLHQLERPDRLTDLTIPTWDEMSGLVEIYFRSILEDYRSSLGG
jgi:glycosyltransferase involved in cell wall biosynthesis